MTLAPHKPVVWEDIEELIERRYRVTIHPFKHDFLVKLYRELQRLYAENDLAGFEAVLNLMDLAVESSVSIERDPG